jgi:hypothetical protein
MPVPEKTVGLSWVSVRDRPPFDGHECALICRNPNSMNLEERLGVGFMETGKFRIVH